MSTLPEAKTPSPKTVYRVLVKRHDQPVKEGGVRDVWEEVDVVPAHGPVSAIKEGAGEESGLYVAVPDRSWQPLQVNVEVKKHVTTERVSPEQSVTGDAAA